MVPDIDFDESFGLNTNGDGEGVILPKTLTPYVADLFKINYMEENLLFEVTSVQVDKINGQKFFKIQYRLSSYKQEKVEENIQNTFVTDYDNIGTKENPIIQKKDYLLIERLNKFITGIKTFYFRSFMNNGLNVLLYQYNDKILYNEFLIRFIKNNDVLANTEKKILNSYYIQDIFPDSPAFYELYNHTIYKAIENIDFSSFKYEEMVTMRITKDLKNNPFSLDYRNYYRVCYIPTNSHSKAIQELDGSFENYKENHLIGLSYNDDNFAIPISDYNFYNNLLSEKEYEGTNKHVLISPHNREFVEKVTNMIPYENKEKYFFENIIIRYLNKTLIIDDDFIDSLEKHHYYPFFKEFILLPILILILKREITLITNNI